MHHDKMSHPQGRSATGEHGTVQTNTPTHLAQLRKVTRPHNIVREGACGYKGHDTHIVDVRLVAYNKNPDNKNNNAPGTHRLRICPWQ